MIKLTADKKRLSKTYRLAEQQRYAEAIEILTDLLSRYEVSAVYHQRGVMHSRIGEHRKAVSDLTHAIELDREDSDNFLNRGNAYVRLKEYVAADQDYSEAIALGDKSPNVYNGRGWARWKLNQLELAYDDFWHAISLDNSYGAPYFNLALVCSKTNKKAEALKYLEMAEELMPGDSEIPRARGIALALPDPEFDANSKP